MKRKFKKYNDKDKLNKHIKIYIIYIQSDIHKINIFTKMMNI